MSSASFSQILDSREFLWSSAGYQFLSFSFHIRGMSHKLFLGLFVVWCHRGGENRIWGDVLSWWTLVRIEVEVFNKQTMTRWHFLVSRLYVIISEVDLLKLLLCVFSSLFFHSSFDFKIFIFFKNNLTKSMHFILFFSPLSNAICDYFYATRVVYKN